VPLGVPEQRVFTWSVPMTPEEIVGLSGTYSGVLVRPTEEQAEFLRRVASHVASHVDGELPAGATLDVPMGCRCWRTTLR